MLAVATRKAGGVEFTSAIFFTWFLFGRTLGCQLDRVIVKIAKGMSIEAEGPTDSVSITAHRAIRFIEIPKCPT